jgi:SAM-dependent methyltransferase
MPTPLLKSIKNTDTCKFDDEIKGKNMIDFCYKLARRCMPNSIYQAIRGSRFGRRRRWETVDTYRGIFLAYDRALKAEEVNWTGKTVLEIGCGDQIYTALFLLANGCQKVILAEPKLQICSDEERVKRALSLFRTAVPEFSLSDEEVEARLFWYNDVRETLDILNGSVDIILTHLVLEHFDDLDAFFSVAHRLLAPGAISVNMVDLSDHTWHIFTRFKALAPLTSRNGLNHLRYSNKTFALLNDPKCFMNRFLLPLYCQKAADYGFDCRISQKVPLGRKVRIHNDVLRNLNIHDEEDRKVMSFHMLLRK